MRINTGAHQSHDFNMLSADLANDVGNLSRGTHDLNRIVALINSFFTDDGVIVRVRTVCASTPSKR